MARYRYPGTQSFSKADQDLFFGRKEDIDNLHQVIDLNKMVILYGKSGLGKTSLLQAGVIPLLEKEQFQNKDIRFTAYSKSAEDNPPLNVFRDQVSSDIGLHSTLHKINANNSSLWYIFKNYQLQHPESRGFILTFDQFEELFTYPEEQITDFKQQLADLLTLNVPQEFKQTMNDKIAADEDFIRDLMQAKLQEDELFLAKQLGVSKEAAREALKVELQKDRDFLKKLFKAEIAENSNFLHKAEIDEIYKPLVLKVVIGIRSDRLSFLDKMTDYFPNIMKKMYELEPLNLEQAASAIIEPAKDESPGFMVAPFNYSEEVL